MLRIFAVIFVALLAFGCAWVGKTSASGEVPRISKEELKPRLASPDVVVLDVRADDDWKTGKGKIDGAIREDPNAFDRWAAKYPKNKTLVLYCA